MSTELKIHRRSSKEVHTPRKWIDAPRVVFDSRDVVKSNDQGYRQSAPRIVATSDQGYRRNAVLEVPASRR